MKNSPKLAAFATVEAPPANAEMWPVHALLWLQPDPAPVRLESSGLRVARRHKPPAPDFLPAAASPVSDWPAREYGCEPLPPSTGRRIPRSDLAPLGWDPRTVCGKGGPA